MKPCVTPWSPGQRTQEAVEKINIDASQPASFVGGSMPLSRSTIYKGWMKNKKGGCFTHPKSIS